MSNEDSFVEKGNYEPNSSNASNNSNNQNENNDEQPQVQSKEPEEGLKESNYNTLDESAMVTFCRDGKRILHKLEYVLLPRFSAQKTAELHNWDLWGPLLICILLCVTVTVGTNDSSDVSFIIIFSIIWGGGILITLNAQFLGAKIGVCQSACLLGYCVFPLLIASSINRIIGSSNPPFGRVVCVLLGYIWSCFSSVGFVSSLTLPEKKFIIAYPVFLFFLALSMVVLFIN